MRLLPTRACASILTPSRAWDSQGGEGREGQALPRQSSPRLALPFPPTPRQVEGEQLSPEPMLMKVSAQHGTDIGGEPGRTTTCVWAQQVPSSELTRGGLTAGGGGQKGPTLGLAHGVANEAAACDTGCQFEPQLLPSSFLLMCPNERPGKGSCIQTGIALAVMTT